MDNELIKRLKSFGWRLGAAILIFAIAWTTDNLELLELPLRLTGIIALALGEVSKAIANYQKKMGRSFLGRAIR